MIKSRRCQVRRSARAAVIGLCSLLVAVRTVWAFDVTTWHYDNLRTGWNNSETILTTANVGSSQFGLITTATVDEQVDAQPLVMLNQTVAGKEYKSVVYVATENNTIYAINGNTGAILLSRNLGTPVPYSTTGFCIVNSQVIGISQTPVIDAAAGIIYLITDTMENNAPTYRLHALKLTNLSDAMSSVVIEASQTLSNGSTYHFNPAVTKSRSALLLSNGNVYAGFTSYCDFNGSETRGWLLGWNAKTLAPLPNDWLTNRDATSPDDIFLTSIWMSGSGIASDGTSLYFVTGNSDGSGNTRQSPGNLTESAVKVSTNLATLEGSFTPYTYPTLDAQDGDFGAGGIMLLPTQAGPVPLLATAMGKDGQLFLLNRASLGGYNTTKNTVLGTYNGGRCWCAESYFTGSDGVNRVVSSGSAQLQTWQVHHKPSPHLVADSWTQFVTDGGSEAGFLTSVSSNGTKHAIIWAVNWINLNNSRDYYYLNAYNANTGAHLVTNLKAAYWPNNFANANLLPVVTNGKVYVGGYKQLSIFGLKQAGEKEVTLEPVAAPEFELPAGLHRVTGRIVNVSGGKIVLSIRAGTEMAVDSTEATRLGHNVSAMSGTVTAVGRYDADGTLFAQSISRAKSDPGRWLPDR